MKSFLIGSLPFRSVDEALDYSFSFSIPTLPNLPKIDEDEFMVDQALREIDGYVYKGHNLREGGPVYNTPLRFLGEEEFFNRLNPDACFKWQACGPLTLQASLDHHPDTKLILNLYLEKILSTQKRFKSLHTGPSLFFLDEPVFGFYEKNHGLLKGFLGELKKSPQFEGALFGLHCCSKVSLEALKNLKVDLVSLDPSLYPDGEYAEIQNGLGAKLVFVPCSSKGEPIVLERRGEKYASAACGQALSSPDQCESVKRHLEFNV